MIRVKSRAVDRTYDIVLFGATGYVGELTAEYLAQHAPPGARIAIAGRNAAKLEALKQQLQRTEVGMLGADVTDPESIRALAEATRVVISTVGPYLQYGEPLVAACAAAGTDYVDLTGEPEFVDLMYLRYHAAAKESGARLVHSCGFDSIPYDLGALFTVSQLPTTFRSRFRASAPPADRSPAARYHSAVNQMGRLKEAGRVGRQRRSVERHAEDGAVAEGPAACAASGVARTTSRWPAAGSSRCRRSTRSTCCAPRGWILRTALISPTPTTSSRSGSGRRSGSRWESERWWRWRSSMLTRKLILRLKAPGNRTERRAAGSLVVSRQDGR